MKFREKMGEDTPMAQGCPNYDYMIRIGATLGRWGIPPSAKVPMNVLWQLNECSLNVL